MKTSSALTLPFARSVTALDLPENMSFEDWLEVGLALARAEHALMWWVGDWWAYGEHRYGERKALLESEEWDGPAFDTCAGAARVCRKIKTCLRRQVLGFSAHKEIAALPEEWLDETLTWAEKDPDADAERYPDGKPRTISAIRQRVKEIKAFIAQGWTQDQLDRKARAEAGECVVANMREGEDGRRHDEALLSWADATDRFVRIDRTTRWGNVFEMPHDGDRSEVVNNFQKFYLPHKPSLLSEIPDLGGKVLGCWCYPDQCHGDVIASLTNDALAGCREPLEIALKAAADE